MSRPRAEPTSTSALALRALAEKARPLLGDDVQGLAVTGSAARGDATPGSDLDLLALVPRSRAPLDFVLEGVPATCFFESGHLLLDLTHLATIEAEHLVVLDDPTGVLADAQALAQAKQRTLLTAARTETQPRVQAHLAAADAAGSDLARTLAWRAATDAWALDTMLARGARRSMKWREGADILGPEGMAAHRRVHGWADVDVREWATARLGERAAVLARSVEAGLRDVIGAFDPARPTAWARKLDAGEDLDAAAAARTWFYRVIWLPAQRRRPHDDEHPGWLMESVLANDVLTWCARPEGWGVAAAEAAAGVQALAALRHRSAG